MPSIKDLKKSIGSVKNTQQTTKAMKMVSAAKLRRAQEAITNQRPYARRMDELIRLASANVGSDFTSPLLAKQVDPETAEKKKLLLLVVTSDRGLCGGFNSNVIKGAQRWLLANQANYASVSFSFLGRKGYEFFKTRQVGKGPYFSDLAGKVTFAKARKLASSLIELYASGQFDEIKVIFNEFKNAVTQVMTVENYLPLKAVAPSKEQSKEGESLVYIFKPSSEVLLRYMLEKNFAIQAHRIMLESQAGEHGARMSAMENATKNAGDMIRKLTLQYNKQRQAGITKELLEIISGSESQKG